MKPEKFIKLFEDPSVKEITLTEKEIVEWARELIIWHSKPFTFIKLKCKKHKNPKCKGCTFTDCDTREFGVPENWIIEEKK